MLVWSWALRKLEHYQSQRMVPMLMQCQMLGLKKKMKTP
jgi:hypothetical protein